MVPQDGLYSLVEQDASGNPIKIIGAIKEVLFAPEDPEAVLKKMASPDTRVVSLFRRCLYDEIRESRPLPF